MLKKDSFLLRHKKKILIISFVFVFVVVGVFFYGKSVNQRRFRSTVSAAERETATATIGNITSSITGSGTIKSASTKNISSEVAADVLSLNVSVGDKVKQGDVLIELDKADYNTKIRELNNNISKLIANVNSYKEDIENLYVYADKSGYISNLSVETGDSVNKNATIFQITNDEYYYITCQVNYNNNLNIQIGNSARIMLIDTFRYFDGEVTYVSDLKEISNSGTPLQTIELKVKNPGYTLDGLKASVTINTATSAIKAVENITIDSAKSKSFKIKSSGNITELNVRNGDYVNVGDLIMVLENDDLQENYDDARTSLNDAYEDLENEKSNLDFYTIIAPIDGIITKINISSGDYVRSESELLTIVNNNNIEFEIEVDELDINDVELGQEVKVIIDAIEETATEPFIGTVSNISIEGTSMNNVTSYPVTISLLGNDDIKMGMNCSAEIIIENKENVLTVPVESVNSRRNRYSVTLADGTEKEVEVGMYDEDNIEIVSGLSEGDVVLLPITVQATSTEGEEEVMGGNAGFNMGMPTGGGMMGGTGGMPQGGNFGGGTRPNR